MVELETAIETKIKEVFTYILGDGDILQGTEFVDITNSCVVMSAAVINLVREKEKSASTSCPTELIKGCRKVAECCPLLLVWTARRSKIKNEAVEASLKRIRSLEQWRVWTVLCEIGQGSSEKGKHVANVEIFAKFYLFRVPPCPIFARLSLPVSNAENVSHSTSKSNTSFPILSHILVCTTRAAELFISSENYLK